MTCLCQCLQVNIKQQHRSELLVTLQTPVSQLILTNIIPIFCVYGCETCCDLVILRNLINMIAVASVLYHCYSPLVTLGCRQQMRNTVYRAVQPLPTFLFVSPLCYSFSHLSVFLDFSLETDTRTNTSHSLLSAVLLLSTPSYLKRKRMQHTKS